MLKEDQPCISEKTCIISGKEYHPSFPLFKRPKGGTQGEGSPVLIFLKFWAVRRFFVIRQSILCVEIPSHGREAPSLISSSGCV